MRTSTVFGAIAVLFASHAVLHSMNLPQQIAATAHTQTRIYSSCWTASPTRGTDTISTR